jgi:homopolymeric O-antigen transport system permease protein
MSAVLVRSRGHLDALWELLSLLTRHRQLTWEMTRREITDRYAGQVFGTLWAIGHPLLLMALYVFVFCYIFPARVGHSYQMPRSLTTYILAGMIPWLTFSEAMGKASSVIVGHTALVKQVVFPIEILPVKGVLASFVTQLVATSILLIYMAAAEHTWPLTLLLLPGLFVLQLLAMVGVSYVLAAVGVYFRDLKDFVQVFVTAGLFLAPILYQPAQLGQVARPFRWVLYANPFSHLVWCYQDAVYFGRFQHPISWLVVVVLSGAVFYGGYRVFRKLKALFGDAL